MLVKLYKKLAAEMNAQVIFEPDHSTAGYFLFSNGHKSFFNINILNINKQASSRISRDKGYTAFFLKEAGFQVPEGQAFFSDKLNKKVRVKRTLDDGYEYAAQLGFPVLVKPNSQSKGRLVTKIYNRADYYRVAPQILAIDSVMLVQKIYTGYDCRIVVFDGQVYMAYQRAPLTLQGDGLSTVQELFKAYMARLSVRQKVISVSLEDNRILANLARQNLTLTSVLEQGQTLPLLDVANLSAGGLSLDVTDLIHPEFCALAVRAAKTIGLRLCGLDILAPDVTCPPSPENHVILETNSAPGFSNYATLGELQMTRVENLFRAILKAVEQAPF